MSIKQRLKSLEDERFSAIALRNAYQAQLVQVQELLRALAADVARLKACAVPGLDVEAKQMLIALLNTVVDDVEQLKAQVARAAQIGGADVC